MHAASNKRMVPEIMFSTECIPWQREVVIIRFICSHASVQYTALQMKSSARSISAINPDATENMDDFCYKHRELVRYHKSAPWTVSKDKWDTKESKSNSMMHAMYVLQYAKRHLSASNSKKIKPVAL